MKNMIIKLWFRPYTPIIFLIIILFGIYKFLFPAFQNAIKPQGIPIPSPQTANTSEGAIVLADEHAIIEAIGKLIRLPSDETPQLISISAINLEQLKNQSFFKDAKEGDVLVIYSQNKKAILFDPKANIILDTAPITSATNSGEFASPSAQVSTPTPPKKI